MTCAWKELLDILPLWMRKEVDALGKSSLQELRLRINSPPELVTGEGSRRLSRRISREDLLYTVNAASRYSPWSAASTAQGYITAAGGHRIGICGEAVVQNGSVTGMKNLTSLCIRVARDFPGIAAGLEKINGSVLILGPPGWGKTTLLRDLIRLRARKEKTCVVDERGELFPEGLAGGIDLDVLSGCGKKDAIPMLLRTMGPDCIGVDEITEQEDTQALLQAANCGVHLLATAHAISLSDLRRRTVYRSLLDNRVFDVFAVLKKDKTYTTERMTEWDSSGLVRY